MYAALPPEVNTGRLIAGAMAEPYLQAEMGWQLLAAQFSAALSGLTAQIAAMSSIWEGMAAERAQAAFAPYIGWLGTVIGLAEARAAAAAAQAAAYTAAVVTTPTLAEIAENHVTHAVLEATNFLGVNAAPIAANEFQYFCELWSRASAAMYEYQAATGVNIAFPPLPPAPPIMAVPGAPQAGLAAVLAQTAAGLPNSIARDALLASLDAQNAVGNVEGTVQLAAMAAGTVANGSQMQGRAAQEGVQSAAQASGQLSGDSTSQVTQQVTQMMSQAPQMAAQVPQQMSQTLGQGPQQLMQMASQPMQQLTSLFQQGGLGPQNLAGQGISAPDLASHFGQIDQLGMYGTSPLGSAGGSFGGAGLLSGAGSGASVPLRTPAGWTAPLAAPTAEPLRAAAVSTMSATTTIPGSGASAVGSGAGMMGPLSAASAARSAGQAVVVAAGPVIDETEVAATVGFEAFDDDL
jgi:PPE-repeat protein